MDDLTILAIDDNEDDRQLYARTLKKCTDANYLFSEVEDGETGLQAIESAPPDCILLDYSLPGRNGVEILKRIRAKHPFAAVVMLTGQGNETVAVTAMQEGAQHYISKSTITSESLQRVIHTAVERCNLQKRVHDQRASLEIFTRALAHDLKEPVRTISSFVSLFSKEANISPQGRDYLTYIQNAAGRMGELIETVYLYLRLEGNGDVAAKEVCDAEKIVEEARENIGSLIKERGAVISARHMPKNISANRMQFLQVIQNLLCNAIHHCETAPLITLEAEEAPDHWRFSVSDNGPGVDATAREKIFEPFKRMLVEDNAADVELTRIMLLSQDKLKCNLMIARSGKEALEKLKSQAANESIDLVLLDINMPGMDGFEVLENMHNLPQVPVVMCSTSTYDRDVTRAYDLGASGYMNKPPELARLRPVLSRIPTLELKAEDGGFSLRRSS
jgi:CheY-like chemotaxis protein